MVTFSNALAEVKDDVRRWFPAQAIVRLCHTLGHEYRHRTLGPTETIYAFLLQVLHGNVACGGVRHLTGAAFTDAAYCLARQRLPLELFRRLLRYTYHVFRRTAADVGLWHGHRVWHVDGSSFSMPDTPALQDHFGQPSEQRLGCGFPVAHLLALFDATTGMLGEVLASPLRTHDMSQVSQVHPRLGAGDVLVADRGFCSYAHLALLLRQNLHAVFRIQQNMIVDFKPHRRHATKHGALPETGRPRSRWLRRLGARDQWVAWQKPRHNPPWMSRAEYRALPDEIVVRELEYGVATPGFRTRRVQLVTTLLDEREYPWEDLAELYGCRWRVETNLRHLKQTLGLDVLRCKSVDGVRKELQMFALAYNLVCGVMLAAAERQGVAPDRISFIDALRWIQSYRPGCLLGPLKVNPERPGRFEPRRRKRRPKKYSLLTKPRAEYRKELLNERLTA